MKSFYKILLFLVITVNSLYSQEIEIVRTDVDSSRRSFVTATYNFSFKIKLNNISNCTAVSFVLRHNQTEYIRFSNYRTYPFSRNGSVFVYPWFNPLDGFERIYAGILNGDTIGGIGEDNPEVIEFEFSVSPDAPNNSILEFTFEDAEAVVTENNLGKIIKLKSQPLLYNIHGFVNVWPGDANNDGIVNINDVSTVALYLGYGPNKNNFRSFQRLNPSTNWFPQLCLAWDSLATTYADCDGDGEITINDMLIIPLNFGKTQFLKNEFPTEDEQPKSKEFIQVREFEIPYIIDCDEPIIGFVAEINENQTLFSNVISDQTASNFSNLYWLDFIGTSKKIITCGSKNLEPINGKMICWGNQENEICGKGITANGNIVFAKMVPKRSIINSFENNFQYLELSVIDFPVYLIIYNILGQKVYSSFVYSKNELVNALLQQLEGPHFALVQIPTSTSFFKIFLKKD